MRTHSKQNSQSDLENIVTASEPRWMVLEPRPGHGDYGSFESTVCGLNGETPGLVGSRDGQPDPALPMTQDVYQRQPLLPTKGDGAWDLHNGLANPEYYGGSVANGVGENARSSSNGVVKIDVPPPLREEPRFPKEKCKTFVALLFLVFNFLFTTMSLAMVHERLPDREKYGPLPDIVLDNVTAADWGLEVSESLIICVTILTVIVTAVHKHRYIVMRRIFLLLGLLYLMRSLTMFVTVLPVASRTYYCSPKANSTSPLLIMKRALKLLSGLGLSINGQHTFCGDYIYSGHTVILVIGYLIIKEYTPKRCFVLHWLIWCCSTVGIIMVLLAHGHYTVDIVLAYYVTTRLFWIYHTLANNAPLKQHGPNNFLGRIWWYPMFRYFERNVSGVVPRQYEWPLPWPRRFHSKHPNRDS